MSVYSKKTWVFIGFVIIAMLGMIGAIEVRFPEGNLSTMLMLGTTALGYGAIFVWLYFHRVQPTPPKPARNFRLNWPVRELTTREPSTVEESLTLPQFVPDNLKSRYN